MNNVDETNPYATSEPVARLDPASVPPLAPPQQVRFVPSNEGLIAFMMYRTLRNPAEIAARRKVKRQLVLSALVLFGVASLLAWIRVDEGSDMVEFVLPAVFFLLAAKYVRFALQSNDPAAIAAKVRSNLDTIAADPHDTAPPLEIVYQIDTDGVTTSDAFESSHCSWQGFQQIVVESEFLFLVRSNLAAHAIPRSAFVSERAFVGFANLAEQLWREQRLQSENT